MKQSAIILLAVLLAIAAAGCGSGSGGKDQAGSGGQAVKVIEIPLTEEEYAFVVDKNQPELLEQVNAFIAKVKEDGTLDEILNRYFGDGEPKPVVSAQLDPGKDQLVVATNAAFEPFEYTVGDKYYGVDMELAALLAEYLGKELVISNMDFDAVVLSVGQGKADIGMAGLTITEERKAYVNFSDKYYDAAQMIIVKASDTRFDEAKTTADVEAVLNGLSKDTRVGFQTGTTAQFYVEGDEDWGFRGLNVTGIGYRNGSLAVQDMLNGNLDFVIIDEEPAKFIAAAFNELQ
ncbi:MAG: amino acid ABC transporter substrate-binding protein [Thermobacillus sp. ZCTH02-B1]|uniref:transporter substrate-binding domain-containing protein n=1 Tax=Thermobacillus sp. ZCTH02-B1 TaxID=1858795 RepID=UPI000B564F3A|nr:transporter substrate-binding domain-containing protein [Thermobacillus sp. ZCTH02-B1]OUM97497.1 MAG: amino acid ABC transporter substrate-binding protein [Thermobacillus sp. ZCTH02-B1]